MKKGIVGILQARIKSTRLPGKVLKKILGQPMLARQIERIKRSKLIGELWVATSLDPSDNPIEAFCRAQRVPCFRGDLDDVLSRFYYAAREAKAEQIVRLTGDCPLCDPSVIDQVIEFHLKGGHDYTSNTIKPTFPDGLDVEVFGYECLERAFREAKLASEREHVTPFFYNHPGRFRIGNFKARMNLSHLRWTVDETADLKVVRKIYAMLYPKNPAFSTAEILELLSTHAELMRWNAHIPRDEGYQKSLMKDKKFRLASEVKS